MLVVFAIVGKSAGWIGKAKEIEVEIAKAKSERIVETVSASGMIQPVYEVKISPDVPGEIIELNIPEANASQPYAIGKQSQNKQLMQRFFDVVTSPENEERFTDAGFTWDHKN